MRAGFHDNPARNRPRRAIRAGVDSGTDIESCQ